MLDGEAETLRERSSGSAPRNAATRAEVEGRAARLRGPRPAPDPGRGFEDDGPEAAAGEAAGGSGAGRPGADDDDVKIIAHGGAEDGPKRRPASRGGGFESRRRGRAIRRRMWPPRLYAAFPTPYRPSPCRGGTC